MTEILFTKRKVKKLLKNNVYQDYCIKNLGYHFVSCNNKCPECWKFFLKRKLKNSDYTKLYCFIMNIIDFRYWFCQCKYHSPYGIVISADCKKHD